MKRLYLLAAISLVSTSWLSGQVGAPNIVFDGLVKDFGKVMEGDTLTHTFKFENKGGSELDILSVEASCGCTGVLTSAKRLKPGESGQIEVALKTEGFGGIDDLYKTVTVTTNDPRQKQVTLGLKASVEPEFVFSERSIYLGEVIKGQDVSKEITISVAPTRDVRLVGVETTDQNVLVKLEPVAGSKGKQFKLIARQKPDAKVGYHFGMITVKTSSIRAPELKISVRGVVAAASTR